MGGGFQGFEYNPGISVNLSGDWLGKQVHTCSSSGAMQAARAEEKRGED